MSLISEVIAAPEHDLEICEELEAAQREQNRGNFQVPLSAFTFRVNGCVLLIT